MLKTFSIAPEESGFVSSFVGGFAELEPGIPALLPLEGVVGRGELTGLGSAVVNEAPPGVDADEEAAVK